MSSDDTAEYNFAFDMSRPLELGVRYAEPVLSTDIGSQNLAR
jgi:hypothetical protein